MSEHTTTRRTQSIFRNRAAGFILAAVAMSLMPTASMAAPGAKTAQAPTSAASGAQDAGARNPVSAVSVELRQFKVVIVRGVEKLVSAPSVKPGDLVEYRAVYTNNDKAPISGLQATLPIPVGMEYLPGSARPGADRVKAAAQDGSYGPLPLKKEMILADGKVRSDEVPVADYRSLRWDLGLLPAGGVTEVAARVRVPVVQASGIGSSASAPVSAR